MNQIGPGNVACVVGLKETITGDTLVAGDVTYPFIIHLVITHILSSHILSYCTLSYNLTISRDMLSLHTLPSHISSYHALSYNPKLSSPVVTYPLVVHSFAVFMHILPILSHTHSAPYSRPSLPPFSDKGPLQSYILDGLSIPRAVFFLAIEPEKSSQQTELDHALAILCMEDPR